MAAGGSDSACYLSEARLLASGATGIDGITAADYAANLEANLLDLLDRIKSGRYQAPPVRRRPLLKTRTCPSPFSPLPIH